MAATDLVAGLAVIGGYTAQYSYLRALAVAVCVVAVVVACTGALSRDRRDLAVLAATALGALQLPWSLAGVGGRPWYALVGLVACPVLLGSALGLAWPRIESALARRRVRAVERDVARAAHRAERQPDEQIVRPAPPASVAPSGVPAADDAPPPGWYRDPSGELRWRWWDGASWTAHTAEAHPPAQHAQR